MQLSTVTLQRSGVYDEAGYYLMRFRQLIGGPQGFFIREVTYDRVRGALLSGQQSLLVDVTEARAADPGRGDAGASSSSVVTWRGAPSFPHLPGSLDYVGAAQA